MEPFLKTINVVEGAPCDIEVCVHFDGKAAM